MGYAGVGAVGMDSSHDQSHDQEGPLEGWQVTILCMMSSLCNGADRLPLVKNFSEELDRNQLYSLLRYKNVPRKDCVKIWSE